MADPQEIDRLLLEIDVKDKTEGSSEKLVEGIATAVSKLNAEIAKLDIGKVQAVAKAIGNLNSTASGGTSSGSTGGRSRIAQNTAVTDLKNQLKELEKTKKEILKTNVGGRSLADALGMDLSDDLKKQLSDKLGLTAIEKQIAETQSKISQATEQQATSQQANVPQLGESVNKVSEATRQINTLLDVYKRQLENVRKKLEKNNLTEDKFLKLKEQELKLEKKIEKETAKQAPQEVPVNNISETVKKLNSLTDIQKYKLADIRKQLTDNNLTEEEYIKLKEQELRLEKQIKGNSKNSLIQSIKRVAVYRAIRALLKMVTNAFKEGINNVAQYSESVNNALSSIKSSGTIISNSIGVMLAPLLQALAPTVNYLAVGLGDLANSFSYLTAKLQGNATYLKVNTEYFKKLNEQSRLLSFDNFEKIQGGNDVSGMFEEGTTADGLGKISQEMGVVATLIGVIGKGLLAIEGLKLMSKLGDGSLLKSINNIKTSLGTTAGQVVALVAGIILLTVGIADIVASWNNINFTDVEKGVTIAIASLVALATAIVAVVMASKGMQGIGAMVGFGLALTGGVLLAGTELSKLTKPKNYAFGGGYNTADLFYANENGQTELIASTNSGGGAVMNMQQLEGAIFSGMTRAMSTGSGESAVYLDGERVGKFVASSSGFRNEANRRNTSLNWR